MSLTAPSQQHASILFSRKRRDFRREDIQLGDKDSHESYTEIIRFADAKADEKKLMIDFSCDVCFIHIFLNNC